MPAPFKFKDCKKGAFVEVNSGARKPWYGMITKKENKKLHVKYFKEIIPGKTSASKGSKAKKWPENTPDDLWTWWAEKGGEYYTGVESIMEMGDLFEIFDRNDLPKDFPKDDFAFLNKPLFKKLLESEEDEEEPTPSPPKAKRGRSPKAKGPARRNDSKVAQEMSEIGKLHAEIQAEGDALQTPIGTLASREPNAEIRHFLPQSQPRVPLGTLGSQVLMESPMEEEEEEVQPTDSENEDSFVMRPNNFEREREENIKRREEDPRMQSEEPQLGVDLIGPKGARSLEDIYEAAKATIAELTPVRKPPQPPKKRKKTPTGHKRKDRD